MNSGGLLEDLVYKDNTDIAYNKRPMGHIAHLSNLGPCRNIICISFPFDPWGPMI
jgi:hypothetical protein